MALTPAVMASGGESNGGGTSLTVAIDCGSGSNKALYVYAGVTAGQVVTSLTFDGGAAITPFHDLVDSNLHAYNYGIINPGAGSKNLVLTFGEGGYGTLAAICFTDANQTTPFGATTVLDKTISPASTDFGGAGQATSSLMIAALLTASSAPSVGAPFTSRVSFSNLSGLIGIQLATAPATGSDVSGTVTWDTLGGTARLEAYGIVAVEQIFSGGGGAVLPVFMNQYRRRG